MAEIVAPEAQNTNADANVNNPNQNRALRDYAIPSIDGSNTSIVRPPIAANNFEIKPSTIQMIQTSVQFCGLPSEDPNAHISNFLEICDTFKYNGVTDDAIRLRLFPFSLRDKAKSWLHSLPQGSITTWRDLAQKFLTKYFPPVKTAKWYAKTVKLRSQLSQFIQHEMETLYEAWKRHKDLLQKCPHHGIPDWMQIQTFYDGLNANIKTMIDAAAGEALLEKTFDEAYELLEEMAANNKSMTFEKINKRELEDYETVALTDECSVILKKKKLPPKLEDPGCFTISCIIGNSKIDKALCDLGASINLMSLPVYKRLGLGKMKPTTVALQLADKSIKHASGMIEDVLVKVDKFILPADFFILDMEEDQDNPILLGRPFLATGRFLIDVQKGEMTMRVQDDQITFNIFKRNQISI